MGRLTLNLSEAQSFKPVDDDTYACVVEEISDPIQGPKAIYVKVTFRITEGSFEDRLLYTNFMLDGGAAGMFVEFINRITGSDHDVDNLEDLDIDPDDLTGLACGVITKQKEYPEGSGEFKSEVQRVSAAV